MWRKILWKDWMSGTGGLIKIKLDGMLTVFYVCSNISSLMGHVMKTTHLINKEEMVHKHLAGVTQE